MRHLQDFAALLLPAGKALVDRARGEFARNLQRVHLRIESLIVGGGVEFFALGQPRLKRGAEKVGDRHAGNFDRVLKGQEESRAGALVGLHFENALAVEKDIAAGQLIRGMAGHHLGERALAGAVLAHDGVHFALGDFKAHALQDFAGRRYWRGGFGSIGSLDGEREVGF